LIPANPRNSSSKHLRITEYTHHSTAKKPHLSWGFLAPGQLLNN